MFGLGTSELILILLVVFVVFGAGKLPELGSGLGKAIKNFKRATNDADIDVTPGKEKIEGDQAGKKG